MKVNVRKKETKVKEKELGKKLPYYWKVYHGGDRGPSAKYYRKLEASDEGKLLRTTVVENGGEYKVEEVKEEIDRPVTPYSIGEGEMEISKEEFLDLVRKIEEEVKKIISHEVEE